MARAALITGAAKRLGRAIALELGRRGWDIAAHYNTSQADARSLADELAAMGRRCEVLQADLTDAEASRQMLAAALDTFKDLRCLVHNASIFTRGPMLESDADLYDRIHAANFRTPMLMTRDFALRAEGGCVLNLLDTKVAVDGSPYFAYLLSKKALADFTRMAARELGPDFRVNGVAPGLILPPPGEDDSYLQKMTDRVPLKRHGGAQDIVGAAMYLIEAEFVTGQVIYVDGGEHLH